jgi:hypothetical protein
MGGLPKHFTKGTKFYSKKIEMVEHTVSLFIHY